MKHFYFYFIFYLFSFSPSINLHAQQFKWVRGGGTNEDLSAYASWESEQTKYMCTDPNGNIYALSQVATNAIIADTFYRSGAYGSPVNIFLTSYNCNGQMRWAKLIAATDETVPYGITADSLGHIYVAGHFQHVAGAHVFYIGYDTAIGIDPYLAAGLIQFDTNGHYKWVRFVGDNSLSSFAAINPYYAPLVIDGTNNAHFFPYMKSGVPLMPGDTSHFGVYDLTYNTTGTLLSAVRLDLDSQWFLHGAVIDPTTNKLYAYGEINQDISGGTATDTFYAAGFDASRNSLWQYFCGHGDDNGFGGVVMDKNKNLILCGAAVPLSGPTTFSFNGDSISGPYDVLAILMKTDTNGTPKWMTQYGVHTSINGFNSITLLPNGKVAATGTYAGGIYYETFYGTDSTSASAGWDPYFVIVDSTGDLQTIQQIRGDGFYDDGNVITSDKVGNIYIGGDLEDSIWAGSPAIPAYHSVGGNSDFFVMKYGVDCSCTAMPAAAFTDTGAHTVGAIYTGTTAGIDSIVWTFGDGHTAAGTTTLHTYTAVGTYQLCVTVYTDCGNDSDCENVFVPCIVPPIASFTDTGTHTIGFVYTGTTTGIDSIVWYYGDGYSDTGHTTHHTYSVSGTYHVCVIAYTPCGIDSSCSNVTITVPTTGQNRFTNANIRVYPNPAKDELYITGIAENTNYCLLDVTGIYLLKGILKQGSDIVPMKNFASGIYILEVNNTEGGERNILRVVKE